MDHLDLSGLGELPPAADGPALKLARLVADLESVRASVMDESLSKSARATLAARQIESLLDQRRSLAARLVAGDLDAQTATAAAKAISDCVGELQWLAERIDAGQWGPKQQTNVTLSVQVSHLSERLLAGRRQAIAQPERMPAGVDGGVPADDGGSVIDSPPSQIFLVSPVVVSSLPAGSLPNSFPVLHSLDPSPEFDDGEDV